MHLDGNKPNAKWELTLFVWVFNLNCRQVHDLNRYKDKIDDRGFSSEIFELIFESFVFLLELL